jgi:hypothetical protein
MVNILLFFILASYLGGIIIPLPTLSRPGRGLQQKEKETISSADCLPAPLSKYMKMPRIFSEKEGQTACSASSHKARKPSKTHILLHLLLHISF